MEWLMKLDAGQTAVITGAASGIGLALAGAVADRGLNVVLADRDEVKLAEAASNLAHDARHVTAVATDVSDSDSVDALAAAVEAQFGPVHLLVNNAGILRPGPAYEQPLEDWRAVFGVNIWGVIHGYRAFVPDMLAHGLPCHVLNTSSLGGLIAATHAAAYMVSKHAIIALSESLAADTAGTSLGVTVLCPGGAATDIFAAEQRRRRANGIVAASPVTEERFARIADPSRADVLDPAAVAAAALEAVERGDMYALRFGPQPRETVRRRLAAIENALQVDEARAADAPQRLPR
jgi:NAD(P)-dependent dehydrogenase (short-subunit alcohol dehydrogenase family)